MSNFTSTYLNETRHLLGRDLLEFSQDTVRMFKRDGESAGYRL